MRSPDFIGVLLQVRSHRQEREERKLTVIVEELKLMQSAFAELSAELDYITNARLSEIQCTFPNTYYQKIEEYSNALWKKSACHAAKIEELRQAYNQQMSAYLSVRRDREIVENLDERRVNALQTKRNSREQQRAEELFLAKMVANWHKRV